MKRYLGVDPGKYACKIAEYIKETNEIKQYVLRTRVSDGDFRDDAIEKATVIVEIDGKVYKVGNGARGTGADLETDKRTETHKICLLTALAITASANEKDEFAVAIGLPAKEWAEVSKRIDYKEYMLPEGDITIKYKSGTMDEAVTKTFTITDRFVYPESIGALFMDETKEYISPTSIMGVIDIGNLNLNATYWQGIELIQDKSNTRDLGGAILLQELSQELSSKIVKTDMLIASQILAAAPEDRHLPSGLGLSDEQIAESERITKKVLLTHAKQIKQVLNAADWSLDVTRIVAIGGTSKILENELKEVLGNVTVLPRPQNCNSLGYLRIMCVKLLDKEVPIPA